MNNTASRDTVLSACSKLAPPGWSKSLMTAVPSGPQSVTVIQETPFIAGCEGLVCSSVPDMTTTHSEEPIIWAQDTPHGLLPPSSGDSAQGTDIISRTLNDKVQPEDLSDKVQPGDLNVKVQPGDLSDKLQPGDLNDEVQPGDLKDKVQPGDLNDKVQPGDLKDKVQPGDLSDKLQPGDLKDKVQPGDLNNKVQPGDLKDKVQPGDLKDKVQPGDLKDKVQPGDLKDKVQPGDLKDKVQPGDLKDKVQPGDLKDKVQHHHEAQVQLPQDLATSSPDLATSSPPKCVSLLPSDNESSPIIPLQNQPLAFAINPPVRRLSFEMVHHEPSMVTSSHKPSTVTSSHEPSMVTSSHEPSMVTSSHEPSTVPSSQTSPVNRCTPSTRLPGLFGVTSRSGEEPLAKEGGVAKCHMTCWSISNDNSTVRQGIVPVGVHHGETSVGVPQGETPTSTISPHCEVPCSPHGDTHPAGSLTVVPDSLLQRESMPQSCLCAEGTTQATQSSSTFVSQYYNPVHHLTSLQATPLMMSHHR